MMKSTRKPITSIQRDAAEKLLQAWEEKKQRWKSNNQKKRFPSREDVSLSLGWTGTMLGQYLRGDAALNVTALIKICSFLEAEPSKIYPQLFENEAMGLTEWKDSQLIKLISDYKQSSNAGKEAISRIANHEARYTTDED